MRLTDRISARLRPAAAREVPEIRQDPVPEPAPALPAGMGWITFPGMASPPAAAPFIREETRPPIMRTVARPTVDGPEPFGEF
jgi:hypothetical protein